MLFSLESERKFDNAIKNTPESVGPGIYNITPVIGNKKKMKAPFGSRSDRDIYSKSNMDPPPPGEYEAKPLNRNIQITSVFQSETKRKVFPASRTPGPTDYQHLDDWTPPPPRSMHHKRLQTAKPLTGFVGQDVTGYTLDEQGKWMPIKVKKRGPEFIGPGSYENNIKLETTIPIKLDRNANRDLYGKLSTVPGPGQYVPLNRKEKLPITISTKPKTPEIDGGAPEFIEPKQWVEQPAPEQSPAFRSRDVRGCFTLGEETPAPTSYAREQRRKIEAGNGFGYKAERNSLNPLNNNPGPGTYESKPVHWVPSRHSAASRAVDHPGPTSDWVPGPGAYKVGLNWTQPVPRANSVFTSKTRRARADGNENPGPGQYTPKIVDQDHKIPPLIHESRFPKHGDWIEAAKIETPAPDQYQSIEIKPGKGRTISATDREAKIRDSFPGPGTYNVKHRGLLSRSLNAHATIVPDDD